MSDLLLAERSISAADGEPSDSVLSIKTKTKAKKKQEEKKAAKTEEELASLMALSIVAAAAAAAAVMRFLRNYA